MSKRGAAPYRSTPNGVVEGLTCGQWVDLGGPKPGRFVRYNPDGSAYVLPPVGRGKRARVSMHAFRLACGRTLADIVSKSEVRETVVNLPAPENDGETLDEALNRVLDLIFG